MNYGGERRVFKTLTLGLSDHFGVGGCSFKGVCYC